MQPFLESRAGRCCPCGVCPWRQQRGTESGIGGLVHEPPFPDECFEPHERLLTARNPLSRSENAPGRRGILNRYTRNFLFSDEQPGQSPGRTVEMSVQANTAPHNRGHTEFHRRQTQSSGIYSLPLSRVFVAASLRSRFKSLCRKDAVPTGGSFQQVMSSLSNLF